MQCTSALTTQIITSCRKALTIILSFVVFAKPFTIGYLFGAMLVFVGVGMHVFSSEKRKLHHIQKIQPLEDDVDDNNEQVWCRRDADLPVN